jgi:hypothetical protein
MCYRELQQFVPEWNKFVEAEATRVSGLPIASPEAAALIGQVEIAHLTGLKVLNYVDNTVHVWLVVGNRVLTAIK